MNREERRREGKIPSRKVGSVDSSAASSALLREAQMHHQSGRLDDAERAYRLMLDRAPTHPDALHGLGLLTYRRGDAKADGAGRSGKPVALRSDAIQRAYHHEPDAHVERAARS